MYDNFYNLPNISEYGSWHRLYFEKEDDNWVVCIEYSDTQVYYSFTGVSEIKAIVKASEGVYKELKR